MAHLPWRGKGWTSRIIVIETQAQLEILNFLRSKLKKGERICWSTTPRGKRATDQWATNRYNDLMKKLGITMDKSGATAHGLRAQYAENAALIAGLVPPTLSGDGSEFNKEEMDRKRAMVSENLGHSRVGVTGSYYESFAKLERHEKDAFKNAVEECVLKLQNNGEIEMLSEELRIDCKTIMNELADFDIPVSPSQVQTLWRKYSQRHGVEWVVPKDSGEITLLCRLDK